MNDYVVGNMYVATMENVYLKLGEPVTYIGIVGSRPRFLVKWNQCHGNWANGVDTIAGYDPDTKTYRLCLKTAKMKPFKENVMEKYEPTEEQLADLLKRVDRLSSVTRAEYEYMLANDIEGTDQYAIPVDDEDNAHDTDDLYVCDLSGDYYTCDDDFETIHTRHRNIERAHRKAIRNSGDYFYCERTEDWWHEGYYTQVYVEDMGETWCFEENDHCLHYCDENDSYYYDENEMPRSDRIPGYHTQSRHWRIPDGITLGVELEVYVQDAEEAYANRNSEIIGERDGSLDDEHGVEFIGAPLNYDDYFKPTNPWKRTLEAINDAGVDDEQDDGYGMHISVGRSALSDDAQARFILFINCCQDFSEFIAQRPQNRWAEYDKKNPDHVLRMSRSTGDSWGSKYAATHVDRHRIEVRIFRSVTDKSLFQKNIDYVMSAIDYAETHLFVEDMMSVSNYLTWLALQEKYQALKDFIGDKGSEFLADDERRKQLVNDGFIVEETNIIPTI